MKERSEGGEKPAKRLRTDDTNGHIWVGHYFDMFFFVLCCT